MRVQSHILLAGALSLGLTIPVLAQTQITIGIMDADRQGYSGRFASLEGGVQGADPMWSIENPVTPYNADAYLPSTDTTRHRGSHTRTYVRGEDNGYIASFIRLDLLSIGKEVNLPVTDATFYTGSPAATQPATGVVNIYGLLPGHPGQEWVETTDRLDSGAEWVQTPPWPVNWLNAPAIDRENLALFEAETFGNGALLGSFVVNAGDPTDTRYSISGGTGSNLVNFLNAAREEGNHLATFILVPGTADTGIVDMRSRDAGGGAALKSALVLTVQDDLPLLPGDANRDGRVDGEDFLIWQASFGTQSGATWDDGDFNEDGRVDGEDFLIWQANFGTVQDSALTPEPAALSLLMLAGAGLMARRRMA